MSVPVSVQLTGLCSRAQPLVAAVKRARERMSHTPPSRFTDDELIDRLVEVAQAVDEFQRCQAGGRGLVAAGYVPWLSAEPRHLDDAYDSAAILGELFSTVAQDVESMLSTSRRACDIWAGGALGTMAGRLNAVGYHREAGALASMVGVESIKADWVYGVRVGLEFARNVQQYLGRRPARRPELDDTILVLGCDFVVPIATDDVLAADDVLAVHDVLIATLFPGRLFPTHFGGAAGRLGHATLAPRCASAYAAAITDTRRSHLAAKAFEVPANVDVGGADLAAVIDRLLETLGPGDAFATAHASLTTGS